MKKLEGKWALVTGASRGVGREIARGLAAQGARLIVHSRSAATIGPTVDMVTAMGVEAHAVAGELSDPAALEAMVDAAFAVSPVIDILYNNAAIQTGATDPFEAAPEAYRRSFEVNTVAPIRICNRVIPGMIDRGYGRVINLTSGIKDQPNLLPYAVSKAALDKYVRDLVPAVRGTGVMVNLLDPGWVRTDLGGPNAPDRVESVLPGVLVPALLSEEVQGHFFCAMDYRDE